MIRCRDLTLHRDGRAILEGINLELLSGERWLLWGPNGAGKTTLARALAGFAEPDSGELIRDPKLSPPLPLLFQDPDAQIAAASVRDEVALGARNPGEPRIRAGEPGPAGRRLEEALLRFELADLAQRNPRSLSGGEKRRLNLAALSVLDCPLLILDEPELHLDADAWRQWVRLLDQWFGAGGRCLLEICRDPGRALGADGLAYLRDGRLIAAGEPRIVYRELRERGLPVPKVAAWEEPAKGAARAAATGSGADPDPAGDLTSGAAGPAAKPAGGAAGREGGKAAILTAIGIRLERPGGGPPLLSGLELALGAGEKLLLLGGNGSGKSSLLLLLAGLAEPDEGSLDSPSDGKIGIAFQEPERLCFAETVREEVGFGLRRRGVAGEALRRSVDEALIRLGLDPERFGARDPFSLSAGELRRVALAAVLALSPDPLLLDEAGAALDGEGLALLRASLADWPGALIWADCRFPAGFEGFFDRVMRLEGGRLVAEERMVAEKMERE